MLKFIDHLIATLDFLFHPHRRHEWQVNSFRAGYQAKQKEYQRVRERSEWVGAAYYPQNSVEQSRINGEEHA